MSLTQTLRLPVSEPSLVAIEERLAALEKAVQELRHELANRYVSDDGDVTEHIRGNYTLLVDGITVLRSEHYTAVSAPELHLNPEEFREGLPLVIPEELEQE